MTNTVELNTSDLTHRYGAGSRLVSATFTMMGLRFVAKRFVRTDVKLDNVELYIAHNSSWMHDFVKYINPAAPDKVDARALHLLGVAEATSLPGADERAALLEF